MNRLIEEEYFCLCSRKDQSKKLIYKLLPK